MRSRTFQSWMKFVQVKFTQPAFSFGSRWDILFISTNPGRAEATLKSQKKEGKEIREKGLKR